MSLFFRKIKSNKKKIVISLAVFISLPLFCFLYIFLSINHAGYSYQKAKRLSEMNSKLEQLGGRITRIPFSGAESFEELKYCIQLSVYSITGINPKALNDNITRGIYLVGPVSYDNYLQKTPPLKNMVRFFFTKTTITNETINHLLKQDDLKFLSFSECTITANNLEELKKLKNLFVLRFYKTIIPVKVFEDDLPIINLDHLSIQNCPVSSKDIEQIKKLTNLKSLYISGVKLSDKMIFDLKKSLPECELTYESNLPN